MKKLTVIALAAAVIMLFTVPAMATDLELSGYYNASGWLMDNNDLNDTAATERGTDAWFQHDFRLDPVFKVHDNLEVVTRLHVFEDQVWGQNVPDQPTTYDTTTSNNDFVTWKYAYLKAKFDVGTLSVGRMAAPTAGGAFAPYGTVFLDCDGMGDRIKFSTTMIEPLTITAIYQKGIEGDMVMGTSDADQDKYYLIGTYKGDDIEGGVALLYVDQANDTATVPYNADFYDVVPYFKFTSGPLYVEGELSYIWGDAKDYHDDNVATSNSLKDSDKDALAYRIHVDYNLDPATIGLGYAYVSGDCDPANDKENKHSGGTNWQPLVILFNDQVGLRAHTAPTTQALMDANPAGNFNSDVSGSNTFSNYGFKLIYATASCSPMEDVTLCATIGYAEVDETTAGANMDDEVGWEYDVGVAVKLMDNLTYNAAIAYLSAGDFWKGDDKDGQAENTWAMVHGLTVTF